MLKLFYFNLKTNNMKSLFFTLLAACFTFSATAQTADEIIAKHIAAIGGKEKIALIKTLYTESTMQVMGNDAPMKMYVINGKAMKTEIEMMGSTIINCMTENGGWSLNPMAGGDVVDMPEKQYKGAANGITLGGAFMNFATNGTTIKK